MSDSRSFFRPEILSRISRLELRARRVVEGFLSGMHKSPYKGFSVEFADYRPYVPGDDMRHLDWRAYAKTDRLVLKQYEVETNLRTHVLLDCSGSMAYPEHSGTDRMTKWEYASTVAACLGFLLLNQQDGVGLALFDHAIRRQMPVSTTRAALTEFIGIIEDTAPADATDVKVLFTQLAEQIPRRGLVVLISDLLADFNDIVKGLQRFRFGQHDVIVVHVLDHDELEFPFTDQTLFEGMEVAGVEVLTDPQSLRQGYLDAVRSFVTSVRSACLNHGIDYALLSTADPLNVALTRVLAHRMRRSRTTA